MAAPEYRQIIPCSGWNYTHPNPQQGGAEVIHPVAAWALLESGEVIGLLAIQDSERGPKTTDGIARLVAPPPVGGSYKPA
jgi:hypothetical protein